MLAGALIRHFFVARHKTAVAGRRAPWGWAVAGVAILLGVAVWLAPAPRAAVATGPARLADVQTVVAQRCVACHNEQLANKGVMLDTPERIVQHAQRMYQQVVVLKQMPLNNATQITEAERLVVARWFEAGARP